MRMYDPGIPRAVQGKRRGGPNAPFGGKFSGVPDNGPEQGMLIERPISGGDSDPLHPGTVLAVAGPDGPYAVPLHGG
ncbi:hypothetical protein [Streptomyces sp. NPDC053560]|uniref:hypothetical protein n=1 Tax=Streptomyces sp. NPDC053560 TaxID=3365711 RepID=UPI0037D3439D